MEQIGMIVNPGTGPINNCEEIFAIDNIKHFITDLKIKYEAIRIPAKDYGEGRYAFLIYMDNICHEVQMPGLPLDKVRFVKSNDQNIWNFARLYIDGSSWVWLFALDMCKPNDEDG